MFLLKVPGKDYLLGTRDQGVSINWRQKTLAEDGEEQEKPVDIQAASSPSSNRQKQGRTKPM